MSLATWIYTSFHLRNFHIFVKHAEIMRMSEIREFHANLMPSTLHTLETLISKSVEFSIRNVTRCGRAVATNKSNLSVDRHVHFLTEDFLKHYSTCSQIETAFFHVALNFVWISIIRNLLDLSFWTKAGCLGMMRWKLTRLFDILNPS